MRKNLILLSLVLLSNSVAFSSEWIDRPELLDTVQSVVKTVKPENFLTGNIKVNSVKSDRKAKNVVVDVNEVFGYVPLSEDLIANVKNDIKAVLGEKFQKSKLTLNINGRSIDKFIIGSRLDYKKQPSKTPFIYKVDQFSHPTQGLDGKIIAMWQSHGWYFEQKADRWQWQRARIFETVEDLYTQSYVIPFLMPMLENAGAYVMSPRERDVKNVEMILDNDGGLAQNNSYSESNGLNAWENGATEGFAYTKAAYEGFDNPFKHGTYRRVAADKKAKNPSTAVWTANIPADGEYAVYVSYATEEKSVEDAHYTVYSGADKTEFVINQKMGGGTWIYLGHFFLKEGNHKVVELSNVSENKKGIITADAVKIGGGYGNIARKVMDGFETKDNEPLVKSEYAVSGYPRFTEGARYWLQWAGMPDSVYSPSEGLDDYKDDYRCRGIWVNYLAGGSKVLPKNKGLNIPVDMSFAFHSDAGTTLNDDIIGTLGIYFSQKGSKYVNGTDRMNSYKLVNSVLTNITNDVRKVYEPNWTRRGMWDASYFEARVPEVPTMLLELLSHQNFADMRYGLDPTFRFLVSRAIYKGIAQYFSEVTKTPIVIQPLPVNSFAIAPKQDNKFTLSWKETVDTLCDSATPTKYLVYERINDNGFKRIAATANTSYEVIITDNDIHSYKIVAANDGGISFPSEILSLGVAKDAKGSVMVINGFTRVSGPDNFDMGETTAGFLNVKDNGVPYIHDINFIGEMYEFRRELPWVTDDSPGFGASRGNYETKVIAGNTFDYPYIHGQSIMKAGYSFISSSVAGVEAGQVELKDFAAVDMILGKQKTIVVGTAVDQPKFSIYSPELINKLTAYTKAGGSVMVTGSFVATDVWDNKFASEESKKFASDVLGYKYRVGQAALEGKAKFVPTYFDEFSKLQLEFHNELNEDFYAVESPDAIDPANRQFGCPLVRYNENNIACGVVNKFDNYKTCILGFPFETITEEGMRDSLMQSVLNFFNKK